METVRVMDVKRYVNMGFVLSGLLVWVIATPLFAWFIEWIYPVADQPLMGAEFRVSNILGLAAALGATAWAWTNENVYSNAMEIGNELSKVTWPKWDDTRRSTYVVIVTTIIIALILGVFDFVWAEVTGWIYKIG